MPLTLPLGIVTSHSAHLLTLAGVILRFRPKVLLLTQTSVGLGADQAKLVHSLLERVGLAQHVTTLSVDEAESYRCALAGDFSFHLRIMPQILDWLRNVRPATVLGDAYEMSNYQHDVGRLMLDWAIKQYNRSGRVLENYEFPLSSQLDLDGAPLVFGKFITGPSEAFRLRPEEIALKAQIVELAARHDAFVSQVAPLFPGVDIEYYRRVLADRNYQLPPEGLARYYDRRGREEVAARRYAEAISFEAHFLPLARAVEAEEAAMV
jgi:hypothetical protein